MFKEDPKKDLKAGITAAVEEKKEETIIPEKEYQKSFDILYLILDYPKSEEELKELSEIEFGLDIFINVQEHVVTGEVSEDWEKFMTVQSNYEDDIRKRLEDFVEKGGKAIKHGSKESASKSAKKNDEEEDEVEERETIAEGEKVLRIFQNARKKSLKTDLIKNTFLMKKLFVVEKKPEEFLIQRFLDEMVESVCEFSFDSKKYKEWVKNRVTKPLISEKRLTEAIEMVVSRPTTAQGIFLD